jgi:predicted GNAT superfamily acetyltransferase
MPDFTFRDLSTLKEFNEVVELERRIWGPGYDDVVPVPILAVTKKRGGILIGAFDGGRMVGFVYSIAGIKDRQPTQWSHMLGVVDEHRNSGLGLRLKLLQRERALAMGLDLIEWTFDPMQAANAHLNFAKLGVVSERYEENVYGESSSPLHKGNPTDRLVAEWWIRTPHVARRLAAARPIALTSRELADAPSARGPSERAGASESERGWGPASIESVNRLKTAGEWLECAGVDLSLDARRVTVQIPTGFTDMLSRAPALALAWRMATRDVFSTCFARGYRAVDFQLDRAARRGAYLLVQSDSG